MEKRSQRILFQFNQASCYCCCCFFLYQLLLLQSPEIKKRKELYSRSGRFSYSTTVYSILHSCPIRKFGGKRKQDFSLCLIHRLFIYSNNKLGQTNNMFSYLVYVLVCYHSLPWPSWKALAFISMVSYVLRRPCSGWKKERRSQLSVDWLSI